MVRVVLFLILIAIGSCTYSPDVEGEFFKEIQINDNPEVSLSLNSFDDGVIIDIYAPTVFSFDYSSDFGSFQELKIYVNDGLLYTSTSAMGSFDYNVGALLQTGIYSLKLEVISKSNTGSLADKFDAEKFVVTKNWTLNVITDTPPPPVLSIAVENGFLKLSWPAYAKSNFVKYQVVRNGNGLKTFDITDSNQNFYFDEAYLGGYPVEYLVRTYTHWHNALSTSPATYNAGFTVNGSMNSSDSLVTLTWNKTKFYGPFENYVIQENGVDRISVMNLNDTTIQFKPFDLVFNYRLSYAVSARNSNQEGPADEFDIDLFSVTPKLPTVTTLSGYNETVDRILGYRLGVAGIYLLTRELQVTTEISPQVGLVLPTSGNFFYTVNVARTHLIQKDIFSDEAIDSIQFSDFAPNGSFEFPYVWSASSNQIVTFGFTGEGFVTGSKANYAFVYDMANHTLIYQQKGTTPPQISPNGVYLFFGNSMHKVENNSSTQLYTLSNVGGLVRFSTLNNGDFYTILSETLRVYDAASGTLKRVINPPDNNYMYSGIDPVTEKILYTKNYATICYAVDPSSATIIPIKAYSYSDSPVRLVSNYLVNMYGNYAKVIPD